MVAAKSGSGELGEKDAKQTNGGDKCAMQKVATPQKAPEPRIEPARGTDESTESKVRKERGTPEKTSTPLKSPDPKKGKLTHGEVEATGCEGVGNDRAPDVVTTMQASEVQPADDATLPNPVQSLESSFETASWLRLSKYVENVASSATACSSNPASIEAAKEPTALDEEMPCPLSNNNFGSVLGRLCS